MGFDEGHETIEADWQVLSGTLNRTREKKK